MKRDDPIFNLLHKADSSAPVVPRIDDLTNTVIRRHRRRRIIRSTSMLGCLVLMIGAGAFLVQRVQPPQLAATQPSIRAADLQLVALNADVELHSRTAKMLVAGEKRRASLDRSRRSIARDDAIDSIRDERNRAGLTLISQADRMNQHSQRTEGAVEIYRRMRARCSRTSIAFSVFRWLLSLTLPFLPSFRLGRRIIQPCFVASSPVT